MHTTIAKPPSNLLVQQPKSRRWTERALAATSSGLFALTATTSPPIQAQPIEMPGETVHRDASGMWIVRTDDGRIFESRNGGFIWSQPADAGTNLAVVKVCDPEAVVGGVVACWIMPVNFSPVVLAANSLLTDVLPANTTFVGSVPAPDTVTEDVGGDRVEWSLATLPPGFNIDCYFEYLNWVVNPFAGPFNPQTNPVCTGDITFEPATIFYLSYQVDVPTPAGAQLVNTAVFEARTPVVLEQISADYLTQVRGGPGSTTLLLEIGDSPDPAVPGQAVQFDVFYANSAQSTDPTAHNCELTLTFPDDWGDPEVFDLGNLDRGQSGQAQATATVPTDAVPGTQGTTIANLTCLQAGVSALEQTVIRALDNGTPVANADSVVLIVGEVTPIDVLANDQDPDGDTLTVTAVTQPEKGTVSLKDDGTGVFYQSFADVSGIDSFTYTIEDGKGGAATATVSVGIADASGVVPMSLSVEPLSDNGNPYLLEVAGAVPEREVIFHWGRVRTSPGIVTTCDQALSLNGRTAAVEASDLGEADTTQTLRFPFVGNWVLATQELENGVCAISNLELVP